MIIPPNFRCSFYLQIYWRIYKIGISNQKLIQVQTVLSWKRRITVYHKPLSMFWGSKLGGVSGATKPLNLGSSHIDHIITDVTDDSDFNTDWRCYQHGFCVPLKYLANSSQCIDLRLYFDLQSVMFYISKINNSECKMTRADTINYPKTRNNFSYCAVSRNSLS